MVSQVQNQRDNNEITKDIFNFAYFVSQAEHYIDIYPDVYDSWMEMEIINAVALAEWEEDGKPNVWMKWDVQYKKKAIDLIVKFLISKEQATNKYWHQYDGIVKNISSFSKFILQERDTIPPYSNLYELWWELDNFSNAVIDIWQQSNKPHVWNKWEEDYKKEALLLLDAFMIAKRKQV